jgi:hypothetical protein
LEVKVVRREKWEGALVRLVDHAGDTADIDAKANRGWTVLDWTAENGRDVVIPGDGIDDLAT